MSEGGGGRGAVVRRTLSSPRLRRVMLGYLVFNVSEWAVYLTLLVWAYGVGGVHTASLLALLQLVPSALLATPLSVLLQRYSRTTALVLGYAAQSVTLLVLAGALFADLPFAAVAAVSVVTAVAVTLTRPAHHALLPEISETTEELTAGNAASGTVEAVATIVGPLASGLLLTVWVPGGVMLVMGLGAGLSVLVLLPLLRRGSASPRPVVARDKGAGKAIRSDPAARLLCALVAAEYVLVGMMDILLVVLALDVLDMSEAGPGLLNSALGLGGLVGAVFTFVLVGRQRLAPAVVLGAVGVGVPLALASLVPGPVVAVVLIAACGAGKLFFDVANRTLIQRLLPDRLLSAVFGLTETLMMAGLALGTLVAPFAVQVLGGRGAFVLAGVFLPLVALLAATRLRALDAATVVPVDVLAGLRAVPFLAVLAPRVVERLALEARVVDVEAGRPVIVEGDPGEDFYVVVSGSVRVTQRGEYVRDLGPGSWFGELALLRDTPRTATVTASTDLRLWAVGRQAFLTSVGVNETSRDALDEHARATYLDEV